MRAFTYIKLATILFCITATGWLLIKGMEWRQGKINGLTSPADVSFAQTMEYPDGKKRVVLFGDSRMAQWRGQWPDHYFVINRGIAGSTSFQALERLERDVIAHQPEWVIIQMGINDIVASRLVFGQHRKDVIHKTASNIQKVIQRIVSQDINIIFMSVVPEINADFLRLAVWQGSLANEVIKTNARLQSLLPDNVNWLEASEIFAHNGVWRSDYAKDALHWNTAAYQDLQDAVIAIIES